MFKLQVAIALHWFGFAEVFCGNFGEVSRETSRIFFRGFEVEVESEANFQIADCLADFPDEVFAETDKIYFVDLDSKNFKLPHVIVRNFKGGFRTEVSGGGNLQGFANFYGNKGRNFKKLKRKRIYNNEFDYADAQKLQGLDRDLGFEKLEVEVENLKNSKTNLNAEIFYHEVDSNLNSNNSEIKAENFEIKKPENVNLRKTVEFYDKNLEKPKIATEIPKIGLKIDKLQGLKSRNLNMNLNLETNLEIEKPKNENLRKKVGVYNKNLENLKIATETPKIGSEIGKFQGLKTSNLDMNLNLETNFEFQKPKNENLRKMVELYHENLEKPKIIRETQKIEPKIGEFQGAKTTNFNMKLNLEIEKPKNVNLRRKVEVYNKNLENLKIATETPKIGPEIGKFQGLKTSNLDMNLKLETNFEFQKPKNENLRKMVEFYDKNLEKSKIIRETQKIEPKIGEFQGAKTTNFNMKLNLEIEKPKNKNLERLVGLMGGKLEKSKPIRKTRKLVNLQSEKHENSNKKTAKKPKGRERKYTNLGKTYTIATIIIAKTNEPQTFFHWISQQSFFNSRAKFIIFTRFSPEETFKIALNYKVYNLLVGKIGGDLLEIYENFPFKFEDFRGVVEVVKFGSCKEVEFTEKLPRLWRNSTVKLGLLEILPYVVDAESWSGLELSLLRLVKEKLGFEVVRLRHGFDSWGAKGAQGWGKVLGLLERGEADLGLGHFSLSEENVGDFDATAAYVIDEMVWVVPKAVVYPTSFGLKRMLESVFWNLSLSVGLMYLVVYFVFLKYLEEEEAFWRSLSTFCNLTFSVTTAKLPRKTKLRVLVVSYLLFNFVVQSIVQAQLYTTIMIPKFEPQISTNQELIESQMEFGYLHEPFKDPINEEEEYFEANAVKCGVDRLCMDRAAFRKDFAILLPKKFANFHIADSYTDSEGKSMLYVFKNTIFLDYVAGFATKGHPISATYNRLLLLLTAAGFNIYHERNLNFLNSLKLLNLTHPPQPTKSLKLYQINKFFYIMSILYGVGCGVCYLENFWFFRKNGVKFWWWKVGWTADEVRLLGLRGFLPNFQRFRNEKNKNEVH